MKILAIRGENLASLTHPFSIDFASGRLGDSGLFAITGNTGSGKSTLLDAMCLALYDQIARFPANKKNLAEIGHADDQDRLKANDVRQILSRGAVAGFAEVDFIGRDGETYRARWSVRRARNRLEGKCQKQERSLQHLSGQTTYAGGQRDVQSQIDEKLSLSWEQFRRAVILPQGDFAAFLKSSVDERSALLERMTGTEHYSRLSMAAFERAKSERQSLELLTSQLSDQPVYSEEDKANLQLQIQQSELQQKKLSQQTGLMNDWLLMQHRLTEMQQSLTEASDELKQSEIEWHSQIASREQLSRLEKVQSVRTEHDQLDATVLELKQTETQLSTFTQQLSTHLNDEESLTQRLHLATSSFSQQETQFITLQPEIRRARELDQRIQEKQTQHEQAQLQYRALQQDVQKQRARYDEASFQHQTLGTQRQQLQQWLDAHKLWQRQAQQQQPLLVMMQDYVSEQQRWRSEQQKRQSADFQLRDLQVFLAKSEGQLTQLQASLATIEQRLQQLDGSVDFDSIQKQQHQFQQMQGLLERCYQLRVLADQTLQQLRNQTELGMQSQQTNQHLQQLQQRQTQIHPEIDVYKQQIAEVRHALTQARLRSQLEELRVYLKDEEPCPLCGSLHHPVMQHQPVNEQNLLAQLEQQHQFLQQQLEARFIEASQLDEAERHYVKAQKELTRHQQLLDDALQQAELQWQHLRTGYEHRLPIWPVASEQWIAVAMQLAEHYQRWTIEAGDLQQRCEQNRVQFERYQQLAKQKEQHDLQLHQFEKQVSDVRYQVSELQNRVQDSQQQQVERQQRLQELQQALEAQLSPLNWHENLVPEYAERWIQEWQQQCIRYQQTELQLQATEVSFRQLESEEQGLKQQIQVLNEQLQLRESELKQRQHELNLAIEQRKTCLQGQSADAIEQHAKQQLSQLSNDIELARESLQVWQETRIALQAQVEHARQSQLQLQAKHRSLLRQTMQQQTQLGISEYEIRQLLLVPVEQVRLLREQLAALDEKLAQAKIRVQERTLTIEQQQKRCEELLASQPQWSGISFAEMQQQFNELKAQQGELEQLLFEYRRMQQEMTQSSQQQLMLMANIERQQHISDRWQQLNDLIGSAGGAKFRTFAQSLTLEQLLLLANHHLNDLAPRYQLQRVPGTDLALQAIDRDMGDDIRAVESLSGGESFLVSLALALGLSSLTAHDTRIESLFIDEGFGTLDPESLDTAIASLDALQASGRQVGVISHVQTLVERIGVQIRVQSLGGGASKVILP